MSAKQNALDDMKGDGEPFVWGWVIAYIGTINGTYKLGAIVCAADSAEEAEGLTRRELENSDPPCKIAQMVVSRNPIALYSKAYYHEDKHRELIDNLKILDSLGE